MEIQVNHIGSPTNVRVIPVQSLIEKGEYDQALREINRLERKAETDLDPGEKGELHYLASYCLYNLGRYKEALSKAMSAFNILKDTSENNKVAQIQDILGRIYWGLGDIHNAELYIRDAITTYRRVRNDEALVQCNNAIARILYTKSEYKKALEYLNKAKDVALSIDDLWMEAKILGNLGRINIKLGNWEKAEEELKVSLQANTDRENSIGMCRDLLSLGHVLALRREFNRAKTHLTAAFKLAEQNRFQREMAIYHEYMGKLLFDQGKYSEAEEHYKRIITTWEEGAPEGDMISQTYRLLAELQAAQKNPDQALTSCQKALNVSRSLCQKVEEGAICRILGYIHSIKGDKPTSHTHFQRSMSILNEVGAKHELALTYLEAGRSSSFDYYRRLGFLANAESLFRDLGSKYHLGSVNLAITHLMTDERDYDKAQLFLAEAENLFKQSNGRKELRQVRDLKYAIEEALFQYRMSTKSNGQVTFDNIITKNTEMREVIEKLRQIKDYDISVLIEGETGTGKDLLAKAVHYSSSRKDKRFVAINCAALPETLLENELFGHKKGAYTGADKDRSGLFEEAQGGTLYLDQVEEIPNTTQVKLLRAIEEKEIIRLGETKPRKIDVRIVCSSIEDLKEAVKKGRFRQDLYFRLNTFNMQLPPLRERKEDIPLLLRYFLKQYGLEEKRVKEFERDGACKRFLNYHWPGNVRELENEIKKMVVLAQAGEKDPGGFLPYKLEQPENNRVLIDENNLFSQVAEFERQRIIEALEQSNWIKLRAAKLLGIPEATIRNKIKKYHLTQPISA